MNDPLELVRLATREDAPAVASVQVRAWRAAYRGLMPDAVLDGLSVEQRTESWARWIAAPALPDHRVWLLEREGAVAGFASTGASRDEGAPAKAMELYAIYLEPSLVGRGLGRALFSHATLDLARRGARAVTLWVLAGNTRAERFYERMGMRADGAEKVETVGGAALRHVRYRRELAACK